MWNCDIRVIPQETVDNNLGTDRLASPKALAPNYCRQPTTLLHDLCLEVLTVYGIELRLFWAKAFPLLILLMSRIWHSSSRLTFTSLAMMGFGQSMVPITFPIADRMHYVLCQSRGYHFRRKQSVCVLVKIQMRLFPYDDFAFLGSSKPSFSWLFVL